jgi:sporulation protein YlmC with PRC-barrel domain
MAAQFDMRLRVITIASAAALLGGSAPAQTGPATGGPAGGLGSPPHAENTAPRARAPAVNPLTMEDVSKISGTAVYDSKDTKIGSISAALMNPSSKTIDRLVVNEGGVLGVGGHHVALGLDAFTWDSEKGGFRVAKTGDELKAMPEWNKELSQAPDPNATHR